MTKEMLNLLLQAVGAAPQLLILTHNNPDPDAIASGVALRYLLTEQLNVDSQIVYQGLVGRAENKALVRYLVHPLRTLTASDLTAGLPLALVDTHPGAGNTVPLPAGARLAIVIDHHTAVTVPAAVIPDFSDIRPELGATSTILTDYLQAANLEPPAPLATALFYGIKTNTMGLGRNTNPADAAAYHYLQPRIDVKGLADIEHARVPAQYFKSFDVALRAAQVYDGVLISYLGAVNYPDLTAEMADLLLRLEEAEWVICMGVHDQHLMISIRLHRGQRGAGQLAQAIVGSDGAAGGHGTIAGGQIPLAGKSPEELVAQVIGRILSHLNLSPELAGRLLFE